MIDCVSCELLFDVGISFFLLNGVAHDSGAGGWCGSRIEGKDGLGGMSAGVGGKRSAVTVGEGMFKGCIKLLIICKIVHKTLMVSSIKKLLNDR